MNSKSKFVSEAKELCDLLESARVIDKKDGSVKFTSWKIDYAVSVLQGMIDCKDEIPYKYRNKYVHSGVNTPKPEAVKYMVKNHVEFLVEFHVANSFGFNSIAEASEFMDLPLDSEKLKRKSKMIDYSTRFRKTGSE